MSHYWRWLITVPLAILLLGLTGCTDDEEVPVEKLPKAVVKAIKAKYPDATLVEAEKETDDGKTVYEVKIKTGGKKFEIKVSVDGTIQPEDDDKKPSKKKPDDDEEKIAVDKLPKVITKAVLAKYPDAQIRTAVKENENGQTIYGLKLTSGGKKFVLKVTAEGTIYTDDDEKPKKKKIAGAETKPGVDKLPEIIASALKDKFPDAKIVSATKETRNGATVFTVTINDGGKTLALKISAKVDIQKADK